MAKAARKPVPEPSGTPSLHAAIRRVLPIAKAATAVSSAGLVAIRRGRVEAYDGRMFISVPVDFPPAASFAVDAVTLDKAVTEDSVVELVADHVVVRTGRYKTRLHRADNILVPSTELPADILMPLAPDTLAEMVRARPFLSETTAHRWAISLILREGSIYATNGLVMVRIDPDEPPPLAGLVPPYLIDFAKAAPPTLAGGDERSVVLGWDDGAFVRSLRIDDVPPEHVFKLVDDTPTADMPIPDEWRAAYAHVARLAGDDPIRIEGERLSAESLTYEASAEIAPDAALGSALVSPKTFAPVLAAATHLSLAPAPEMSVFAGPRLFGVFMTRTG